MRSESLSARRAWIEIALTINGEPLVSVALRKESVDRNDFARRVPDGACSVALRKESVDRNLLPCGLFSFVV